MASTEESPPTAEDKGLICYVRVPALRGIRDALLHSKDQKDHELMFFIIQKYFIDLPKSNFLVVKTEDTLDVLLGAYQRAQQLTGLQEWPFYSMALVEIPQQELKRYVTAHSKFFVV